MSRIVYLNGSYIPETEAKISIFDRGFVFADAVYEVTSVLDGKLLDFEGHNRRLRRSLSELEFPEPAELEDLLTIHRELVARNNIVDGSVYLQISRGNPGDRDFHYPSNDTPPTVVLYTQAKPGLADSPKAQAGIKVISMEDIRWGRRDIKTVQLLYPSMAKMAAAAAGASDAWLVQDGFVTEGSSNTAYIIKDNTIITRHLGNEILHGITRAAVLRFAQENSMKVEERPFSIEEAKAADEAFFTSASNFVTAVVEIDGTPVASGKPGPMTQRLREIYISEIRKTAI